VSEVLSGGDCKQGATSELLQYYSRRGNGGVLYVGENFKNKATLPF
jgi:hypothetical protein